MKNLKVISMIALIGALFFTSCSKDEIEKNSINEINKGKDINYSTYGLAADASGNYTGTYTVNSMLIGGGPYANVSNKKITITADETAGTIYLKIEPFKVGKMPADINIRMKDIPYKLSGSDTFSFQGTQITGNNDTDGIPLGFSVLGVTTPVTVDGTITKTGTQYDVQLKLTTTYAPMNVDADVDFGGTK